MVNSVSIPQYFRMEGDEIKIPRLKTPIKFKKHREIEGKMKSVSITKLSSGKLYLNVLVDRLIER